MKYIKFFMRNKENNITLPMDQAERILKSPQQLVMVHDQEGNWTGITINKAEIIGTDHNFDRERDDEYNPNQIAEPDRGFKGDISKFKPKFLNDRDNTRN